MNDNYVNVFSIFETIKPTNQDIVVTLTPPVGTLKYEYYVYKNNELIENKIIHFNEITNLYFSETGEYKIDLFLYDGYLNVTEVNSGSYIVDKEKPMIELKENNIKLLQGNSFNAVDYALATDTLDGDITNKIDINYDMSTFNEVGMKKITYSVSDEAGNISTSTLMLEVMPNRENQLLFFNGIIGLVVLCILILFIRYNRSIKLEKRIAKYTIEPLNDNSLSLFDKFFNSYSKLVSKIGVSFEKSVFLTNYSKRYDKYINTIDNNHKKPIDFVVTKTFVGILLLMIAVVSKTIQSDVLALYEIIIPITVGFFIPDIIYFTKYKVYRMKIENDLLQAIIIMNNAFKSGRSITQAIDLVSTELDGPIAEEFKKMSLEISFGLAIEDVFKRFSERIMLPEVTYLTASLSILNKTGGNIVKVFSSIEKTLFGKKKLKLELDSLTGSSKIIVYILFVVPILFVAFISIIDPTYFLPLLTTPLGLIITFVIAVVYVIYIIVVRKVMKVRMWKNEKST